MAEIYISTDVETDGPIPGPHSMLSIGSAAIGSNRRIVATFSAKLMTLPGASGHPATMDWWKKQETAWDACREDPRPPDVVMTEYADWLDQLDHKPVFVAYPAGFDFTFVYWYLHRFVGRSPFSHSALDMKTLAMALLKKPFRESTKRNMPKAWFPETRHTHVALDDAIEQGLLFCSMLAELRGDC